MQILKFILVLRIISSFGYCNEVWINFIGNQSCQPNLYYEPTTLEDLCDKIKFATSKKYKIRAAGNGYSISDIACTNGCLFNLKFLNRILEVNEDKKLVRVETGINLHDLNAQLAVHSLALSNQPAIDEVSLGGALSTGVHGTGHTGSLSSFVREIELITADGCLHKLSPELDHEMFKAASISLGSLGVIYAVTLQCEPLFYVQAAITDQNLESILNNYKKEHNSNDFFQFFWNVETDKVTTNAWNRCSFSFKKNDSNAEPVLSYKALPGYVIDINDKELFSEIAIPLDFLPIALQKLKLLFLKYKQNGITLADVNVRFVDQDSNSYLSPSSEEAVAYVALCILEQNKNLDFYREFEDMMIPYKGRPHWGKTHFLDYHKAHILYGKNLQKFIQIKRKLDPENVFCNSFTDRVFQLK